MLNDADQLRCRFLPTDEVGFLYRRKTLHGTIIRTNPKRAVIRMNEDEYTVPYELLTPNPHNAAMRETKLENILSIAQNLFKTHRLKHWTFTFDHSIRRAGCCHFRTKCISISIHLALTASDADIRDTILHEIAHALVGKKHNHDEAWRAKAIEIGGTAERCHRLKLAPPRYSVTCKNHCWTRTSERRNPRLVCRKCGGKLVYSRYEAITATPV